ncbi:MAG: hypothetical protein KDE56_00360 [Anaerolineales bacterium]|nr:hypothetical protein [Anaerolineales bacterium]
MDKSEKRKLVHITQLMDEIEAVKKAIDADNAAAATLSEGMEQFQIQYELYVSRHEQKRQHLERQLQQCRRQIERLLDDLPEPGIDEAWDGVDLPDGVEAGITELIEMPVSSAKSTAEGAMQQVRNHFARHWHPDHRQGIYASEVLMTMLNIAFEQVQDVADLLGAIPWHPVWQARQPDETIGECWERLMDWETHLLTARDRAEQRLEALRHDWRYPLYVAWREEANPTDYLADLAAAKQREIERLAENLHDLQMELAQLRAEMNEA